jgi:hypothetical protein
MTWICGRDGCEAVRAGLTEVIVPADRIRELEAEIQGLQRALSFWHPGVRANGTAVFVERAAHDAWLLAGYEGENEPGAAELGWIEVTALETRDVT